MSLAIANDPGMHDPIWGAGPIGEVIGRSAQQTHYLLKTGQLPGTKIGNRWMTTRAKLREFFDDKIVAEPTGK